ncbi:MAG: ABC transporter ATP-binding protein [Candidatus Muirbacterium halophilum]|nr:ABC transporter ATP-binding protein [Candidatus Muirbacterium halophilum]MCK9475111.1 ABC transporter ATP-binding protein [Candidatus Muirbacterium halophilum]
MIELQDVVKKFGNFEAVKGINLNVKKGEILGLLGPNGAGKTTTMRMITGFFPQTSGQITIGGEDIFECSMNIRKKIGYLPEKNPLYYDMRVYEYIEYAAKLKKVNINKSKIDEIMEKTGLVEMRKRLIGNLSKGYKQRTGIAQALINDPEILILDEPTSGLDPRQIVEIRELIRSFAVEHTVILSTHILPEVHVTCDRVVIMNKGKIISEDTPENMLLSFKKGYGSDIVIEANGSQDKIINIIQKFSKSFNVAEIDGNFKIKLDKPEKDIRAEINKALINDKIDVLEIYSENPQLEEVFITLVKKEEEQV